MFDDFCKSYCKYPALVTSEQMTAEDLIAVICRGCPYSRSKTQITFSSDKIEFRSGPGELIAEAEVTRPEPEKDELIYIKKHSLKPLGEKGDGIYRGKQEKERGKA